MPAQIPRSQSNKGGQNVIEIASRRVIVKLQLIRFITNLYKGERDNHDVGKNKQLAYNGPG